MRGALFKEFPISDIAYLRDIRLRIHDYQFVAKPELEEREFADLAKATGYAAISAPEDEHGITEEAMLIMTGAPSHAYTLLGYEIPAVEDRVVATTWREYGVEWGATTCLMYTPSENKIIGYVHVSTH